MAKVQVPATWMAQHYLPPICARHGKQATSAKLRNFYTRAPRWSYPLILVGLVIFAIVTLSIRTTIKSQLPGCAECAQDRKRFITYVIGGWLGTLALISLGIALSSDALVLFGFLAVVPALMFCFAGDYFRVAGTVSQDRLWVNLKGVDDRFANAITNALHAAATPVVATPLPYQQTPASYQQIPASYQPTPNILPNL